MAVYVNGVQSFSGGLRSVVAVATHDPVLPGVWHAHYRDPQGCWKIALDARGQPIRCATEDLAASVANHRHRRVTTDWSTL